VDETPQVRLSIASLQLASGLTFEQYVMRLPRCAMTVVLDDAAERILLIWRHRFIIDRWMWELPGGYIDPGEDGIAAAAREVETGYRIIGAQHALLARLGLAVPGVGFHLGSERTPGGRVELRDRARTVLVSRTSTLIASVLRPISTQSAPPWLL
jgi:hypothetical protein